MKISVSLTHSIRAFLGKENLVLCKSNDTQFAVDGVRELEVLHEMSQMLVDAYTVESWDDDITAVVPTETVSHLRALSVVK